MSTALLAYLTQGLSSWGTNDSQFCRPVTLRVSDEWLSNMKQRGNRECLSRTVSPTLASNMWEVPTEFKSHACNNCW
jgi:hypothetical protein